MTKVIDQNLLIITFNTFKKKTEVKLIKQLFIRVLLLIQMKLNQISKIKKTIYI